VTTGPRRPRRPPPARSQARVLAYAILPKAVPFINDGLIFIGKGRGPLVPLKRVPRLAICEEQPGAIRLLFCEGTWKQKASSVHKTAAEAKARAKRMYPGASRYWVAAHVTKAQAAKYLDRVWARHRCLFCLKTPLDHDEVLVRKGRGRICGGCVTQLAKGIRDMRHGR
jgi:hypothetical protein